MSDANKPWEPSPSEIRKESTTIAQSEYAQNLRMELAEALKDKARLDWMEKWKPGLIYYDGSGGSSLILAWTSKRGKDHQVEAPTLREAIDKAMGCE